MVPFGVGKFRRLVVAGSFTVLADFLMGFVGVVLSGRFLSVDAMAGVSLLSPVFTACIFASGLFGNGMGVCYALEMGRCRKRRAHEIFTQSLWCVLATGLVGTAALYFGIDAFVSFMGPSPAVAAEARRYALFFAPAALLEPVSVLLMNMCYADGDDGLCGVGYAVQLGVNVAVSAFGLWLGHGVAACAWGAVLGYLASAVVLSAHFLRASNSFRFVRHFSWRDSLSVVKMSFGDSSSFLCDTVFLFFLGKYCLSRFGAESLPVLSVVMGFMRLQDITGGVGNAIRPVVTVYVGERNFLVARRVMRDAMRLAVVEGAAVTALALAFGGAFARMMGVADPSLASDAALAVRLVAVGCVGDAVCNLLNGYFVLVERQALAVGLTLWTWLLLPVAFVFAGGAFGANGLYLALGLSPLVAAASFFLFLAWRHGREAVPFLLDRSRDALTRVFDLELAERPIAETAERVGMAVEAAGYGLAVRARLVTEEALMLVRDRNDGKRVRAEVTVDLNDGVQLVLRDDGCIFDITDTDARVNSLRSFLVASMMERQKAKVNLVTTGFNRNVFRF